MLRTDTAAPLAPPPSLGAALLREARPRQWAKNVLLLAAPVAAGTLADPARWPGLALAVVAFCLAASGTYFLNDVLDLEADRLHPVKRQRPIAAGLVGVPLALGVTTGLFAAALLLALLSQPWPFTVALTAYVAITVAYSTRLKHVPVVDVVTVAAGFFLRAVAGGLAAEVPLSEWFLLVAGFGALFVVTGKRHAEVARLGEDGHRHRAVLSAYPPAFTAHLLTLSSGVAVVAHSLWAFEPPWDGGMVAPWSAASVIAFLLVMLRYALLVYSGRGGEPEELVLGDRPLQVFGSLWAVALILGIYT